REICHNVESAINRFIELSNKLLQKVSNSEKTYLSLTTLDSSSELNFWHHEDEWHQDNPIYAVTHYNRTLYELNISASIFDFSLEYVDFEKTIGILQRGIKWIGGIKSTDVALSAPVRDKCAFLSFKIMARIKVEDPNMALLIDSKPYDIDIIDRFDEWSNHISRHYEINGAEEAKAEIRTIKDNLSLDYSQLKLGEINSLIKFYKDYSASLHTEIFDKLHKAVDEKYHELVKDENRNKFDEFAYKFALNYVLNNQLSDTIEKAKTDTDAIHSLYNRICRVQEETNIDNFFPHSKYLGYLLDKIATL